MANIEMIASYSELDRASEDKVGPWLKKRHGCPDGFVYVNHEDHHWIFRGDVADVLAMFNENWPTEFAAIPGKKNHYRVA